MTKIQYENSDGRVRNEGQQPWTNEGDYLDTTIVEVQSVPFTDEKPHYDWRYVNDEFVYDIDLAHPIRVSEINKQDVVDYLKASPFYGKTLTELNTMIDNALDDTKIDNWNVPQDVKDDMKTFINNIKTFVKVAVGSVIIKG